MKKCSRCGLEKSHDEFRLNKARRDGLSTYCSPCERDYQKSRYHNPEKHKQIKMARNLYLKNRKDSTRKWYLKTTYGITPEDYQALYDKNNGKCYICLETKEYYLHVDHNHNTGKIRGLLCNTCNRGIGLLKDNAEIISRAARYMEDLV
jgi:hypothetical protein